MAALGIRARIAFVQKSPCNISVSVANVGPASPTVQVILNGAIIGEYTTLTTVSLPCIGGPNVLELVAADGGLMLNGQLLASTGNWLSLYPNNTDPMNFASGGSGANASFSTGGTTA